MLQLLWFWALATQYEMSQQKHDHGEEAWERFLQWIAAFSWMVWRNVISDICQVTIIGVCLVIFFMELGYTVESLADSGFAVWSYRNNGLIRGLWQTALTLYYHQDMSRPTENDNRQWCVLLLKRDIQNTRSMTCRTEHDEYYGVIMFALCRCTVSSVYTSRRVRSLIFPL